MGENARGEKAGSRPDKLQIEGGWGDALRKLIRTLRPPGGVPGKPKRKRKRKGKDGEGSSDYTDDLDFDGDGDGDW